MTIGTTLFTLFHGRLTGKDAAGNRYYEEKSHKRGLQRRRRWVIYADGQYEASEVPAEWHAWLHYTTNAPLPDTARRPWQKPYVPNMTGTPAGYRPPGHDYEGGHRAAASGDYEPWTPQS